MSVHALSSHVCVCVLLGSVFALLESELCTRYVLLLNRLHVLSSFLGVFPTTAFVLNTSVAFDNYWVKTGT
jgi:hypothetical protein